MAGDAIVSHLLTVCVLVRSESRRQGHQRRAVLERQVHVILLTALAGIFLPPPGRN